MPKKKTDTKKKIAELEKEIAELSKKASERDEFHDKYLRVLAEYDNAKKRIEKELGDLFFLLVSLARHWGLNAENVVRHANQEFFERFKEMEEKLKALDMEPDKVPMDE